MRNELHFLSLMRLLSTCPIQCHQTPKHLSESTGELWRSVVPDSEGLSFDSDLQDGRVVYLDAGNSQTQDARTRRKLQGLLGQCLTLIGRKPEAQENLKSCQNSPCESGKEFRNSSSPTSTLEIGHYMNASQTF